MTWAHWLLSGVFFFAFGACLGSFFNVCLCRLPRGQSVVRPRSRCPKCHTAIAVRDNVPILSWLLLRGRCRHCGLPISARYPCVELLTGAIVAGLLLGAAVLISEDRPLWSLASHPVLHPSGAMTTAVP